VIDGAMGTSLQQFALTEADFRGSEFATHARDLKGNNDLLTLTRPDVVKDVYLSYLRAGANIVETNTFSPRRSRRPTMPSSTSPTAQQRGGAVVACRYRRAPCYGAGSRSAVLHRRRDWAHQQDRHHFARRRAPWLSQRLV
jgi:hypothetical protein